MRNEGLHVDFAQNVSLALAPESAYFGASKYQELSFVNENSFRLHIEGLQVDF